MTKPTLSKSELRGDMLAKRRSLTSSTKEQAAARTTAKIARLLPYAATVGTYASFDGEIAIDALPDERNDLHLAWPRVNASRTSMEFARSHTLPEKQGEYGIREPIGEQTVPANAFDAMLIPGVAFSRRGVRLGMGKGFYDRFLANLREDAVKIGVCYDWQLTEHLPEEPHDIRMQAIITDQRVVIVDDAIESGFFDT
jgi:5-formyltetrahydrofolate cyclo-ligase